MDIKVKLDKTNIVESMIPCFNAAVSQGIQSTLAVVKDRWQQEAQQRLKTTRADYLLGLGFESIIYPYEGNEFMGAVRLQGKLPNMIEQGFGAYDIKSSFKQSKSVKNTKSGGWYVNIPFRHGTPGSYQVGQPMPNEIYTQASKLPSWGSLSIQGGQKTSWTGYVHKNNIYDSMTRIIKQYDNTQQSMYYTWRRMSSNSDADSWMHPGYSGVHIAESIAPFAEQTANAVINSYVQKVFEG